MELEKTYNPKKAEETHYRVWEERGYFAPEINENKDAEPFSIIIPPPNVTGNLHMGHALQHTLMDVLTRWKRMSGFKTLFLVGVDHAGISTQLMVTRQLKKDEHKTPQDIGREAFTEKVWEWKHKYGGEIQRQIRREGLSVDWSRERFTMDESLSRAVREVFVRLYEEGNIYRGNRIVNWCPRDKTVLSDLEVKEEKAKDGKLYYLKYPVKKSPPYEGGVAAVSADGVVETGETKFIVVATTRPETMLGDTAVAVNPEDERYNDLIGQTVELPLTDREIPIIADEYVESDFGTGAVKITPAHDANDYEVGLRHDLPQLNVMNKDATMTETAGKEFAGLDRFAARQLVVEKFEELGLLEKIDDYDVTLPHCERCKTVIEPLLSLQWFVKMDEMRDLALDMMRKERSPRFFPQVPHEKIYTTWLNSLKDWTISRQLWWGHQIPAWYDDAGNVFVARTAQEAFEKAGTSDLVQDADVLDTWFSSALWSFSTLGWTGESVPSAVADGLSGSFESLTATLQPPATAGGTDKSSDLETFHPTSVLVTGRDIIFLWVSRMVMTALKFVGEKPFDDVIIHGTVLDKNGQRMSKTKMNGIDPLDVFEKFGVDATRMALAGSATGVDFAWRDEKVESFRNFANKIWNATRFCLMNSEGASVDHSSVMFGKDASIADRWILSRLNRTALNVNKALAGYQFHEAVQLLYHFFWDDFCDWYIELVKDEITAEDASEKRTEARTRIITTLEIALRLLHPFMPFLTEELWQKLPGISSDLHHNSYRSADKTIMLTSFPPGDTSAIDEQAESEMRAVIELISKVRNIRAEMNIKPSDKISLLVSANEKLQKIFAENEAQILKLAKASEIKLAEKADSPKASARAVLTGGAELAIPLEGLIDFEKEMERLENQVTKLEEENSRLENQLKNQNFVERAPPEKVREIRERVAEIETQSATLKQNLDALR